MKRIFSKRTEYSLKPKKKLRILRTLLWLKNTFKTKEQILESIVEYDNYDSIDFENTFIWKKDLEPLIENYIQQQINKIESNTLELTL